MTELPDRLLRGALQDAASATPSKACVDADALAAWVDGTMNGSARAAFEAHAAGCARCQALMAVMVRIEPPPAQSAWWRRQPFGWLVPLATVAALAVVVVNLTVTVRRSSPPASTLARSEPAAADRVAPPVAGAAPPAVPAPAAAAARREDRAAADKAIEKPRPQTLEARAKVKTESVAKDAVPAAAAPAAAPLTAPPPAMAPSPAAPAPAAAPPSAQDAVARAERANARAFGGAATASSRTRSFPWRIADRKVERTADGGLTWVRIAVPDPADLVAVEATDASHATVTTADGRTFVTSDGGKTWTNKKN